MIPKVELINKGFGEIELRVGKEIPPELGAWIRAKANEKFIGQPMFDGVENHIQAKIDNDLTRLVDNYYIKYVEHKNTWVVMSPLFKWVKYDG